MTTHTGPRPVDDFSTRLWQVTGMSALPDWIRHLLLVLYTSGKALQRGLFAAFLLLCLALSLKKLVAALALALDGASLLVADVFLVLYAAWHVYHDGHHAATCQMIARLRARAHSWRTVDLRNLIARSAAVAHRQESVVQA